MSQPDIPNLTPTIAVSRNDAVNLIITSIALEELGLGHILNAEGEKLQYVLGTLPGFPGPAATLSDVLLVNDSIRSTLEAVSNKEWLLNNKLQAVIHEPVFLTGPTGATGPQGIQGPDVTGNYLSANFDGNNNIAPGGALPLNQNGAINGTAIQHTVPSPTITLAANQAYYVSYETRTVVSGGNASASVNIFFNGNAVPGSGTQQPGPVGASASLSSAAIIETGGSAGTLQLQNTSTGPNTTFFGGTIINVIKIR